MKKIEDQLFEARRDSDAWERGAKQLRSHLANLVDQCVRGNLVDDHGHNFIMNQRLKESRDWLNHLAAVDAALRKIHNG